MHPMPRPGALVHTDAVRGVLNVGSAAIPTVEGSERVKVVAAVAGNVAGYEPRKSRFRELSHKGRPQVKEPGPKTKRAHSTPFVGAKARGWWVVTAVEATWLGQSV